MTRQSPCRAITALVGFAVALAGTLFAAAPAFARVPPDHVTGMRDATTHTAASASNGAPLWTYAVVAAIALAVGVVATYQVSRLRARPVLRTA